jgi:CBS domain-containing protein
MTTERRYVADLMTLDPVVIRSDAPLEDAAHLLSQRSVSGLPVVDPSGGLVGVISQTDLVALEDSGMGRVIRGRPSGLRVGEVMSAPPITIPLAGSLREAAQEMIRSRVHRLVVTDDAGHPIGVLSATDFVELYAEG